MKKNIASADRVIRVMIAFVIVLLFVNHIVTGTFGIVLMAIAVIFTITSFINFCPIYYLLGIKKWQKSK